MTPARRLRLAMLAGVAAVVAIGAVWLWPRGSASPPQSAAATPAAERSAPVRATTSTGAPSAGVATLQPADSPLPTGEFRAIRPLLEQRAAAGDAKAALRLARVLTQCRHFRPTTDAEVEEALVEGLATTERPPMLDGKPAAPDVVLDIVREKMLEQNALCTGTHADDFDPARDAAAAAAAALQAAEAGDTEAMSQYAAYAFAEFERSALVERAEEVRERRDRAIGFLERAFKAGDPNALEAYAAEYTAGRLFERDPMLAYAYFYAFAESDQGRRTNRSFRDMGLQWFAGKVSAADIDAARSRGLALLAECCGGAGAGR